MACGAPRIQGLYAITPAMDDTEALVAKVRLALAGGARVVQYRNKLNNASLRREQASALLAQCREAGVPFIINDDVELALAAGADGVHLFNENRRDIMRVLGGAP